MRVECGARMILLPSFSRQVMGKLVEATVVSSALLPLIYNKVRDRAMSMANVAAMDMMRLLRSKRLSGAWVK